MTHAPKPTPTDDAVERLVDAHLAAASEEIAPSSGFAASVMESIHAQATEPPPIAFPWGSVLPGAIAIVCALLVFVVFAIRAAKAGLAVAPSSSATLQPHLALALSFTPGEVTLGWIVLAACLSIAAIAASFRLTGRSE
jgi:hypothetical protein